MKGLLRAKCHHGAGICLSLHCCVVFPCIGLPTLCLALVLDSQGGHVRSFHSLEEKGLRARPRRSRSPSASVFPVSLQPSPWPLQASLQWLASHPGNLRLALEIKWCF